MTSDMLLLVMLIKRCQHKATEFSHDDHVKKLIDEMVAKKTGPCRTVILRLNMHGNQLVKLLKQGF